MDSFTHLDESGSARMVDVSGKDVTARSATATGRVLVSPAVVEALRGRRRPQGRRPRGGQGRRDHGGQAHAGPGPAVPSALDLRRHPRPRGPRRPPSSITATVRTTDRTGVEMEALTAVSVAALTVVDMVKSIDKGAVITDVRVEEKTGGKSGTYRRDPR